MLPSFLYSSYKQYKEDTKYVTEWLAQTAKLRGYVFSSPTAPKSAPKLVPKVKIKNKKKALAAERDRQSRIEPYLVSTKELLCLAQHISRCTKPPVTVPLSILTAVKRTIEARQHSNDHYTAVEPASDKNDSHAYFIQTLKTILEILKTKSSQHERAKHGIKGGQISGVTQDHEAKSLDHDLSGLNLESSDADSDAEPSPTIPLNVQHPSVDGEPPQFTAESMREEEKLSLAVVCLFRDVQYLVQHVSRLWKLYTQGKAELVATAASSKCAVDLIKRLEEDFMSEFTQVKCVEQLISGFYWEEVSGRDLNSLVNADSHELKDIQMLHQAEVSFYPMYKRFASFCDGWRHDARPVYEPLQTATFNSAVPRHAKSSHERIREDDTLFQAIAPLLHWDFVYMVHRKSGTRMVQDPFVRAMRLYIFDKKYSLYLIAAGQCFLEAIYATAADPNKAFNEVRALGRAVKASALKSVGIDQRTTVQYTELEDFVNESMIERVDELLLNDPFYCVLTKKVAQADDVPPPFAMMKVNPMLCGMHALSLLEDLSMTTNVYVNRFGAISAVAHLVNAVQQEGACSLAWPEMERMIKFQEEEFVFVGGRPKAPEQYYARYMLAMGTSAVQFASDRHANSRMLANRRPRFLKHELPTLSLLREWWTGEEQMNLAHVELLLNQSYEALSPEEAATVGQPMTVPEGTDTQYFGVRKKTLQKPGRKSRDKFLQTKSLTPEELLVALRANVTHETPMRKFDYLDLHRQCWRLLERIIASMGDLISSTYGPNPLLEERNLGSYVVPLILQMGCSETKMADRMLRARAARHMKSPTLLQAGKIVEEFLSELEKERKEGSIGQFDEAAFREEES